MFSLIVARAGPTRGYDGGQPGVPSPGQVGKGGLGPHNTWKPNQEPNLRSIPFCVGGPKTPGKLGVFCGY